MQAGKAEQLRRQMGVCPTRRGCQRMILEYTPRLNGQVSAMSSRRWSPSMDPSRRRASGLNSQADVHAKDVPPETKWVKKGSRPNGCSPESPSWRGCPSGGLMRRAVCQSSVQGEPLPCRQSVSRQSVSACSVIEKSVACLTTGYTFRVRESNGCCQVYTHCHGLPEPTGFRIRPHDDTS